MPILWDNDATGTATSVGSDEIAAKNANYPLIIGHNVLWQSRIQAFWSDDGTLTGNDESLSGAPGRLAYDGRGTVQTSPDNFNGTSLHLVFDLYTSTSHLNQVDSICILGHNFEDVDGGANDLTLNIKISNDASFGANTSTIMNWTAAGGDFTDNKRLYSHDLSDGWGLGGETIPSRMANFRYVQIALSTGTSFSAAPRIGEIFMGRRYQLGGKADRPYPEYFRVSETEEHISDNGVMSVSTKWQGAHDRSMEFNLGGSIVGSLVPFTVVKDFAKVNKWGTRPFIYVENPADANPVAEFVRFRDARNAFNLTQPEGGPFEQIWPVELKELRPFASSEYEVLT